MRIIIKTFCLKFISISFCFGMEQKFQAQFQSTPLVEKLQKTVSQQALQITTDAIVFSIEMVEMSIKHLPKTINLPPSTLYINARQLVEESLNTLAGFLNIAFKQKLKIDLNPVQYKVNGQSKQFYTVSTAIDFSHYSLLKVCTQYTNNINTAVCCTTTKDGTTLCDAQTKYGLKQKELYAVYETTSYSTPVNFQIRSYLVSELAKLSEIWDLLTIPI